MQMTWPPSRDSIFGDTYGGVPNPMVPHRHPWPTRYHGPIYTVPGVAKPTYCQRPYAKAPYLGIGAAPFSEALGSNLSGSPWIDALLGAGLGFVAAPEGQSQAGWVVGSAVAAYGFGLAGFAGIGAMLLLSHRDKFTPNETETECIERMMEDGVGRVRAQNECFNIHHERRVKARKKARLKRGWYRRRKSK